MILYKQPKTALEDYILVTPADSVPITLDQVKEHLKITDDDSNDYLFSLIKVVTGKAEQVTGRDLITKTYKGFLDCFPGTNLSIQVRKSKLQSITSIEYYVDGVLTTLDATQYYITETDTFSTINLFNGNVWPTGLDSRKQAVVITFVAGYGDDGCDVPAGIKQAMLSSVASLYDNAGDCTEDDSSSSQSNFLYKPYILPTKLFCVV